MILLFSLVAAGLIVPAAVGTAMCAVRQSVGDERGFWAWAALASLSMGVMFACLLFTAGIEQLAPLIVACIFFVIWGLVALFARFYVYR